MTQTLHRQLSSPLSSALRSITALVVVSSARLIHAQATPPSATADETVVLSPFTVQAEEDRGYLATSTLAGTRLRTDLRDVAAAISVITPEFMNDIGAHNPGELLVYTLGTDVTGIGGNFSGQANQGNFINRDVVYGTPSPTTRLRSLNADNTRDYFQSFIPFDSFNVERVEINRGPNSVLYGLGAPGGILNYNTIRAQVDRSKTTVQLYYGSYGTRSASVDGNLVLAKDQLAVRVAAKTTSQFYQQEEGFNRDSRLFLAATYQPFKSTSLRASYEAGRQRGSQPIPSTPTDNISHWWDVGRPTYNPLTGAITLTGTPTSIPASEVSNVINSGAYNWGDGLAVVYSNPNSSTPTLGLSTNPAVAGAEGTGPNTHLSSLMRSADYLNYLHRGDNTAGFWFDRPLSDPSVFDFYNHILSGHDNDSFANWHTTNVTLEQRFLDNDAGIELSANNEGFRSGRRQPYGWNDYSIKPDINETLVDGTPNPNFGRPFIDDVGWGAADTYQINTYRATVYYRLDFRKVLDRSTVGKILGEHTLTGNYTHFKRKHMGQGGRPEMVGLDYYNYRKASTPSYDIDNRFNIGRTLVKVKYLGPSLLQSPNASNAGIQAPTEVQNPYGFTSLPFLVANGSAPGVNSYSLIAQGRQDKTASMNWYGVRDTFESNSPVGILQSRWFDGDLVTTLSYRKDSFETASSNYARDDATGIYNVPQPLQPGLDESVKTFSWGAVGHLPKRFLPRSGILSDLSLSYNKSDNTQPSSQLYTVNNDVIDLVKGKSKEVGLSASLFSDRVNLRLTRYDTKTVNSTINVQTILETIARLPGEVILSNSRGVNADNPAGIAAFNTWLQTPAAIAAMSTYGYQITTNPDGTQSVVLNGRSIGDTTSTQGTSSKGYELEVIVNATKNWRLAFNGAKADATSSDTAPELVQWVNDANSLWTGAAGGLKFGGYFPNFTAGQTVANYATQSIANPVRLLQLSNGRSLQEVRKYRFNVISNYTFSEGSLTGFSVGGAVRWLDKAVIGYPIITDPVSGQSVQDVGHPYRSDPESHFDAWVGYERKLRNRITWSVQLNVRNVGEKNHLVTAWSQPDGTPAAYTIGEPMTYLLTTRFQF